MNIEKIGSFIAALRKSKGLTQQEVAECLGVSDKTVSKWECGNGLPDITSIPAIAELFEVTSDEILRGERIMRDPQSERELKKTDEQLKYQLAITYQQIKSLCVGIYVGMIITFLASLYWASINGNSVYYLVYLITSVIAFPKWINMSDTIKRIETNDMLKQHQISIEKLKESKRLAYIALFMLTYVTLVNISLFLSSGILNIMLSPWIIYSFALFTSSCVTTVYISRNT